MGFIIAVAVNFFENDDPDSVCKVASINLGDDTFIVNGEFDYGVLANVVVQLDGPGRDVVVTARLETNQGDISKTQRINVQTNASRSVQFQFIEPSITTVVSRGVASCT